MAQRNYPMNVPQGATFTRTFTVTIDGDPWNFTGYSALMQVRESFDSPVAAITLGTFNGMIALGDEQGTITLTIDADTTDNLTAGAYVYDMEVTSAGGEVTRILPTAPFNVLPGVTRV